MAGNGEKNPSKRFREGSSDSEGGTFDIGPMLQKLMDGQSEMKAALKTSEQKIEKKMDAMKKAIMDTLDDKLKVMKDDIYLEISQINANVQRLEQTVVDIEAREKAHDTVAKS